MHQRVPENPPGMCKTKGGIRCGCGEEKAMKRRPLQLPELMFLYVFTETSIRPKSCVGIPLRELAGFRTLIRALCEPGRTSKRIFSSFGGF